MLTEQTVLVPVKDVTYESLGPEEDTVVLSFDSGQLYTCNETAAEILAGVDGQRNLGQIIETMEQQYDVSPGRLRVDVLRLSQELVQEGLVRIAE